MLRTQTRYCFDADMTSLLEESNDDIGKYDRNKNLLIACQGFLLTTIFGVNIWKII